MASSGPPQSGGPRQWRWYVYSAIIGVLSLIVAPFIVEVLKIEWARRHPVPSVTDTPKGEPTTVNNVAADTVKKVPPGNPRDDASPPVGKAQSVVPPDQAASKTEGSIEPPSRPSQGHVGDFAGTWDVYLGKERVRQVKLGITKDQSGDYEEPEANAARSGYYQLENNGGKLLLFKTGGLLVEQGLVSWINGNEFTYKFGNRDYRFQRRE